MKSTIFYITLIVIAVVGFSSIFIVDEKEQAIVIQFGKPVTSGITDAGLYFKIPIIQQILRFDKRILEWDGNAKQIPTKDDKYIFIDAFARWRISDPLQYYKATRDESRAQSRLDDILDGIVRDEISNRMMTEIIRSTDRDLKISDEDQSETSMRAEKDIRTDLPGARMDIISSILKSVQKKLTELQLGIEVVDVQLKRINYNKEVQGKVFNRMISRQNQIAEKYRALGEGKKKEILGKQVFKKKEILSDAYLTSQSIKGEADARAIKIYAEAYEKSPEFYNFIQTLDTYKNTIDSTTQLILSTDNPYLRYMGK
jgi:membrane protease subunit HflC